MSSDHRLWRSSLWVNLGVKKNVNKSCRTWIVSHFSYAVCALIWIHLQYLTHLKRQLKLSSHIPFSWTGLTNSAFLRQHWRTHCQAVIGNFWGSSLICLFLPHPQRRGEKWKREDRRWEEAREEVDTCSVIRGSCLPKSAALSCRGWSFRCTLETVNSCKHESRSPIYIKHRNVNLH